MAIESFSLLIKIKIYEKAISEKETFFDDSSQLSFFPRVLIFKYREIESSYS